VYFRTHDSALVGMCPWLGGGSGAQPLGQQHRIITCILLLFSCMFDGQSDEDEWDPHHKGPLCRFPWIHLVSLSGLSSQSFPSVVIDPPRMRGLLRCSGDPSATSDSLPLVACVMLPPVVVPPRPLVHLRPRWEEARLPCLGE
jgi:hypothetical protein